MKRHRLRQGIVDWIGLDGVTFSGILISLHFSRSRDRSRDSASACCWCSWGAVVGDRQPPVEHVHLTDRRHSHEGVWCDRSICGPRAPDRGRDSFQVHVSSISGTSTRSRSSISWRSHGTRNVVLMLIAERSRPRRDKTKAQLLHDGTGPGIEFELPDQVARMRPRPPYRYLGNRLPGTVTAGH
jgi:hypothetical protein